jgi:hypothetical protein
MLIRLTNKPVIDNLRNYPEDIVDRLATALREGAVAQADPRRKGFYDLSDGDRSYFIHVSPVSGHVWLLASWLAERVPSPARYVAHFAAPAGEMARLY